MKDPPGPREFATTHWSLVVAAKPDEASQTCAREALEELCRAYWYPLYAFARNLYVQAGVTTTITGTAPGNRFFTTGPFGQHFVRASFTPSPTSGIVVYSRSRGRDAWNRSIESEIRESDVRDVAQTFYYVY